jgi:thioredoxin 1
MMEPVLEDLKTEYAGRMQVEFIDVWKNREQAAQYGVQMIPTQIFYDAAGKELFRRSGFIGKDDILAKWRELGYDFSR